MTTTAQETCWRVRRLPDGTVAAGVAPLGWVPRAAVPEGEVVVRVEAAGFNYKDALCCAGHPGVMRTTPLVPGIVCCAASAGSRVPPTSTFER